MSIPASVLWALGGLIALGTTLRFSTLGIQSYHHDEIITVAGVLPRGFLHMLRRVQESESNPPLYYVVAWPWSKLFGNGEVGMRSLSALLGTATVPVVFLAARETLDDRAGLIAAALAAVNPMLIWYSQEARSYSMLIFFGALSLLFFLRSLHRRRDRDLALWALASAAALCSHYFAAFQVAIEAGWLLAALPERRRATLAAVGATALVGLALVPLLLSQINATHIGWIANMALPGRVLETGVSFLAGETGHVIAEPPRERYALIPALMVLAAFVLIAARGTPRERRRALAPLLVGVGVVALGILAALAGKDYLIERNLLPALVPALIAAAIAFSASQARRIGLACATALCLYWLGFAIQVALTPNLQRPNFRDLAERLGRPHGPREIVGWELGATAVRFYLPDRSERVFGKLPVREIDVASKPLARGLAGALPPAFHRVERVHLQRMTLTRYRAKRAQVVPYYLLRRLPTGFGSNGVVADGLRSSAPGAGG
ncbi:MAG TPA: glycosyltransferase family 39 protein [Solirubrobacterales bacterium]